MTRSFSSLSISNALCLTSVWILVALGIYVTKMQKDQEQQDIYDFFSQTNWTNVKNDTEINLPSYYLSAQSLETISKSLIWFGFILDSVVCFTEFMVVWLKVQAPSSSFYWISAGRYLTYIFSVIYWYDLIWMNYIVDWKFGVWSLASVVCFTEFMVVWLKVQAPPSSFYWLTAIRYLTYNVMSVICWYCLGAPWFVMAINLSPLTLSRIIWAYNMYYMNKELSDEVDGINNPVVHAIGPTGKKAMAGA